jgi:hypothetical protein
VTSCTPVTQGERSRWQRRAAAELTRTLDVHPGLPVIAWTVGPAGSVLAGRVNGLAPAEQVRATFEMWRSALALEDYREHATDGGTAFLHAAARRDAVTVRLTASVFDHDDKETAR